ncbi:AraC family transcriptional regulator [Clostridium bowmanii]|uniref:AraC family transcriptional regulator n=1 Tax=Clostridium bowmanii TaxID=132925 RepID=UPI001C0AB829|nr:AraC family transcriptional regulator [Clostridium bowmanii]MBU3191033.1 AraC family transcriptional regulator [Clostridium bowmanii]MCA1075356.1 AraC family transcriptional regulator [Clostridium bowmanii]
MLTIETSYEEKINLKEGILYPFECHIQKGLGKGILANAHYHYYIELLYCISGKAQVFISGKSYDFYVGDMVLINSREVHSVYKTSEDEVEYIVVKFDPNVLYSTSITVFETKYVFPFTLNKSTHQKVFTNNEIKDTYIPGLLHGIFIEYNNKNYGFELAIRNNIGGVFLLILRNWYDKGLDLNINTNIKENTLKKLQGIFDYVDKNYMSDISAESVASNCNMSYSYFSRFFKASVGKAFSQYLNYVRITEAEKLLLCTNLNITEIGMEIGYTSSSYFIQQFKHYKNISPKQFKIKFNLYDN